MTIQVGYRGRSVSSRYRGLGFRGLGSVQTNHGGAKAAAKTLSALSLEGKV